MLELLQKGKAYEGAHWERKAGISAEFSSVCEPGCVLIFIHNIRSIFSLLSTALWPGVVETDACSLIILSLSLPGFCKPQAPLLGSDPSGREAFPWWLKTELVNLQGDKSQVLGEGDRWKADEMLMLSPPEGDKSGAAGFVLLYSVAADTTGYQVRTRTCPTGTDYCKGKPFQSGKKMITLGVLLKWFPGTHEGNSIGHAELWRTIHTHQ